MTPLIPLIPIEEEEAKDLDNAKTLFGSDHWVCTSTVILEHVHVVIFFKNVDSGKETAFSFVVLVFFLYSLEIANVVF